MINDDHNAKTMPHDIDNKWVTAGQLTFQFSEVETWMGRREHDFHGRARYPRKDDDDTIWVGDEDP